MSQDMISVDEARRRTIELASQARFRMPVEKVDLFAAVGRVAAADLTSDIDVSPFDNTAMDGFAVVSSSLESASEEVPVELEIVDWVGAGIVSQVTLAPGQAIRIMTGGIMPEGADAVVKIEDTTFTGDGGVGERVRICAPVTKTNVRKAGEEAKAGDVVVRAGEVIRAATVGLLASTGNTVIPVYARPKVGVISIGTELVKPPAKPSPARSVTRTHTCWVHTPSKWDAKSSCIRSSKMTRPPFDPCSSAQSPNAISSFRAEGRATAILTTPSKRCANLARSSLTA